jgi:flagellar biosynthesis protein FlhA
MAVNARPAQRRGLSDIYLAVAVVVVVGMMILPLPPALLDALITINIGLALTVLLVSMYIREPLEFSVFPSLLLVATLFRLGLNVSATRQILLHGYAGRVIDAFGHFVIGGNYVIGVVIFLILIVIQFVVITNGAGRVAEVAARFTLDAMPGKQMAIDADLNAGIIDEAEARRRRRLIELEADFYGAMDGASKFVKGDAVAGVVIILINIVGGIVIGVLQRGLPIDRALQTYTVLTVGDGLVSQIPALLISTATGIIVTRAGAAEGGSLGQEMTRQILYGPKPLAVAAGLLGGLALIPGMPTLPFMAVGAGLGGLAYALRRSALGPSGPGAAQPPSAAPEPADEVAAVLKTLQPDPLELEVGYGLIPLVEGGASPGGSLLARITLLRRQIAQELGFVIPTVRVRDNLELGAYQYRIKLRGVQVASGEVRPNMYLVLHGAARGAVPEIPGEDTKEPVFGLPARWIEAGFRDQAELSGHTVVDPAGVIITHLSETVKSLAAELLTRQDVRQLVDQLKSRYPALVEELIPDQLSLGELQRVLQNLLRERVPIRDLVTILEAISPLLKTTRDPDQLSEAARQGLCRLISQQLAEGSRVIGFALGPGLQELLLNSLTTTEGGSTILALPSDTARQLLSRLAAAMESLAAEGHRAVLFCPPKLRLPLRRLTERSLPGLVILSYAEVAPGYQLEIRTAVELDGS